MWQRSRTSWDNVYQLWEYGLEKMRFLIDYNKRTQMHELFDLEKTKGFEGAAPYRIIQFTPDAFDDLIKKFLKQIKVEYDK